MEPMKEKPKGLTDEEAEEYEKLLSLRTGMSDLIRDAARWREAVYEGYFDDDGIQSIDDGIRSRREDRLAELYKKIQNP